MVQAIVVGVVVTGGVIRFGLRWHAARAEERAGRSREQLAAVVLYEEMKAAISALDLALRDEHSKWLVSMSESRTLSEAWHEHGRELLGIGAAQWEVLSAAVTAMAPSYNLLSVRAQTEDLRRSLTERRDLLVEGTGILRAVYERRTRSSSRHSGQICSLVD
jgi:hypothetical protein